MMLDEFKVTGKNLKVNAVLRIKSARLNGSTSSTASAHQGYQPKRLTVTVQISHDQPDDLKQIFNAAETLGDNESPKIYTIVDKTANAIGVKQCQFMGDVRVRQKGSQKAWQVSFTLVEHLSVAEKIEQRQPQQTAIETSTDGQTVTANETQDEIQLTEFEKVLRSLDNSLS